MKTRAILFSTFFRLNGVAFFLPCHMLLHAMRFCARHAARTCQAHGMERQGHHASVPVPDALHLIKT
ncbi:hypothetical protein APS_1849 [Acetobacter pasteurianus subsp. pasteurianus LMG 1262 = NBRC 106471]|nr:hypothetical protein APS_1849 [Acetobacter pasteurianus subsp. pasteurianus LMG 1262 = NBRC 106471]